MAVVPSSPRRAARSAAWAALATVACGAAVASRADAYPHPPERWSGATLSGPTDGDLAALFYNPAALRLMSGGHIQLYGGAQGFLGGYQRAAALPGGFAPDGQAVSSEAPIRWAAPLALGGFAWDLGSRSVTVAVAFSVPYSDFTRFPEDNGVTRYHAVSSATYSLWGSAGAALRLTDWLYVGGVFNFGHTTAATRVFLDGVQPADGLPCSGSCERYAARQDLSLGVSGWGYGFSAGLLVLPLPRLWIGLGVVSPLFTSRGAVLYLDGFPAQRQSATAGTPCPPGISGACVATAQSTVLDGAALLTALPVVAHLGARYRLLGPTPDATPVRATSGLSYLDLVATLRLTAPPRGDQELRLQRTGFEDLPRTILWPRGLQTAVALDLSVRAAVGRLLLAPALLYESPRASSAAVSPANLESHKLNLALSVLFDLSSSRWTSQRLGLLASFGATFYLFSGDSGAGFDAAEAARCRDAGLDLLNASCLRTRDGWAAPTAQGSYRLITVQGSLGLQLKL